MATNFLQKGESLHYKVQPTDNIKSGDIVLVGDVCGIAITDGIPGELLGVGMTGVYEVPVPASVGSIAQGTMVYYSKTDKEISLDDEDILIGPAWEDGEPGDVVPVKFG